MEQRTLDGDTTCSTSGYFDGYFNEIGGFTGCEWLYYDESNEYGLSVQWDSLPDTNFQFNWVEASCVEAATSTVIAGNARLLPRTVCDSTPGYCQSILVPFSFTISEPDPTPVIAEVDWDDLLFVDGTTCETSGYQYGYFDNPSDYNGCNEFYSDDWGTYGMWVGGLCRRELHGIHLLYSVICEEWNEVGIEYSGASEGTYSGNFVIHPEASCQLIHIPFSFTVSEEPIEVITAWSAPMNGGAICTGWGTAVTESRCPSSSCQISIG